jgi:hypothetical protein
MKKGIVMEVKSDTIIMMTPEGEFIKSRKQPSVQYEIGEELTLFPQEYKDSNSFIFDRWTQKFSIKPILAGAAALLMLIFILLPAGNDHGVYAYVSVDINPSFEISIDGHREVIQIKPFNDKAKRILEDLSDWKGKSVSEITEEMITLSTENGYMNEQKKVSLTTVFTEKAGEKDRRSIENEIEELTSEESKEGTADISSVESSLEIREEAAAAGMSTGQLLMNKEKPQQKRSEKITQPSVPENKKEEKAEVQTKPLPKAADKRQDHVKEKQAPQTTNGSNLKEKQNRTGHGSDKKEEDKSRGSNGDHSHREDKHPGKKAKDGTPQSNHEEKHQGDNSKGNKDSNEKRKDNSSGNGGKRGDAH